MARPERNLLTAAKKFIIPTGITGITPGVFHRGEKSFPVLLPPFIPRDTAEPRCPSALLSVALARHSVWARPHADFLGGTQSAPTPQRSGMTQGISAVFPVALAALDSCRN